MDNLASSLVEAVRQVLQNAGMEPGHVKVLASAGTLTSVANWVASDAPVELSVASQREVEEADMLINVRAQGDPDQLAELVREAIFLTASGCKLHFSVAAMQHFRPGRPVPTYRYATPRG